MIARMFSSGVVGLDAELVEVEAVVSSGLPATVIVGLPDASVQESKERVKSAIKQSGFSYPQTKVTVNLAPADLQKIGTHYDTAIALSILVADEQLTFDASKKLFIGELSLDGSLRGVSGVLAMVLAAKKYGFTEVFVSDKNIEEARLVSGIAVYQVKNLRELTAHLLGHRPIERSGSGTSRTYETPVEIDFADIAGQDTAKHALMVAASGAHNLLMVGPPGSGKTMLAKAMLGIMPRLTEEESLELTKIYSIAGNLQQGGMVMTRPFRSPHHTSSHVALVGGGSAARPGEVTMALHGVLFADELLEFPRHVLEALRQPMEDGVVTVSRARATYTYPARFTFVAALNPCPCGFYQDKERTCKCPSGVVQKYQRKLSGPIVDRIDLHIEVPRIAYEKFESMKPKDTSADVRAQVEVARERQYARFKKTRTNSSMSSREVKEFCQLDETSNELLKAASRNFKLSARSIHRVLKVARTLADIAGQDSIDAGHISMALQYRPKDS